MKRIALVDADTPLYVAALQAQATDVAGERFQTLDTEYAYKQAVNKIEGLCLGATGSDARGVLCFTHRRNFRKDLLATYKANRKDEQKPLIFAELKRLFTERQPWPVQVIDGLEADDLCGILSGWYASKGYAPVIVSEDKDMLQIPGLLFRKKEVVMVTKEQGDRYHLSQTLIGDATDNYGGCPGWGPKKALRFLGQCASPLDMWKGVIGAFEAKGLSADYALTQARVAKILQLENWDMERKEPILWTPPATCPATLPLAA
jgi:DNA polymerase-1